MHAPSLNILLLYTYVRFVMNITTTCYIIRVRKISSKYNILHLIMSLGSYASGVCITYLHIAN